MRSMTMNHPSMAAPHFTGSNGSMERSTDTDTTKSKSSLSSEARDTFLVDGNDLINPAKRDTNFRDDNSMNFDTKNGLNNRRSIGAMSDSGASFQTSITANETVIGSILESPYGEEVSVAGSVLSREASVDPRREPLSATDEEAFLKGEDPEFRPEFRPISWEQSPGKGLSRQSSTRSELTAESFGPSSGGRQTSNRQLMRQKSKRGRSFRTRGPPLGESEAVIKEGEEVTNEVTIGAASPVSDFLPDSSHSVSEDSLAGSSPSVSRSSPYLRPSDSERARPQPEDQRHPEDATKPSLKNSKNMAFVSRSASSFGSSDAPGLASSDVSLESTSPGVMSGRATLSSIPQMQSELSPVKEKKKSKSKKEKKSKKGRSRRHDDDTSGSSHKSERAGDRRTQRVHQPQSEPTGRRGGETSSRSGAGGRQDTPRFLKKKSLSLGKKERPSLHTLFEWSCDGQEEQGSRPRPSNHRRSGTTKGPPQVRSRQLLRRASNDDGPRARSQSRESPRRLLSRSMSMPDLNQDIQQMTMTPKWPKRRFNNSTFHQQFYQKDHDKVRLGSATPRRRTRNEAPSVTPQQMLNIMEPCSMREVLAFNGFSDEFGPASNHMVNYADVLDNQSVFTASTGTSSAKNLKKSKK